jgi:PEP-CTERM motif
MKTKLVVLAASIFMASPASAASIIAPISGVIDSGGPGFGSLTETFNQAGLLSGYTAGVTDFDSYLATNPLHTLTFSGNEWFGNSGTTAATVTYDFGALVSVDRLALWNEESSGIGTLNLLGSTDGLTFTSLGTYSPFDNPLADYPAEVFSFGATSLRYARFEMSDCPQVNPGSFAACAIGEVAFRTAGAVPEPATWGMMLLGFGAIGGTLRRQRKSKVAVRLA